MFFEDLDLLWFVIVGSSDILRRIVEDRSDAARHTQPTKGKKKQSACFGFCFQQNTGEASGNGRLERKVRGEGEDFWKRIISHVYVCSYELFS